MSAAIAGSTKVSISFGSATLSGITSIDAATPALACQDADMKGRCDQKEQPCREECDTEVDNTKCTDCMERAKPRCHLMIDNSSAQGL